MGSGGAGRGVDGRLATGPSTRRGRAVPATGRATRHGDGGAAPTATGAALGDCRRVVRTGPGRAILTRMDKTAHPHPAFEAAAVAIVAAGRRSGARRLIAGCDGNLSVAPRPVRPRDHPRRDVARTSSRRATSWPCRSTRMSPRATFAARPSSDLAVHRAAYVARPEAHAIAHAHPPAVLACLLAGLRPDASVLPEARAVLGRVAYVPALPFGGPAVAAAVAGALRDPAVGAVLLDRHGVLAVGSTMEEAVDRLEVVELLCATWHAAWVAGGDPRRRPAGARAGGRRRRRPRRCAGGARGRGRAPVTEPGSPRVLPGDDPAAIAEAAALLRAGRLVAFPTETVYGLGANALDAAAVARVFAAKERPVVRPAHRPPRGGRRAARHVLAGRRRRSPRRGAWRHASGPGPLTLVLRKRDHIPGIVTAGLPTVGLRVPDHPVARALIRAAGVPVAAPSANRFGRVSPTRAEHVARGLGDRVDLVLDGGPCRVGVESTVVLLADGRAAPPAPRRRSRPRRSRPPSGRWRCPPTTGPAPRRSPRAGRGPLRTRDQGGDRGSRPAGAGDPPAGAARRAPRPPGGVGRGGGGAGPPAARSPRVEVLAPDGDPVASAARLFDALHDLDDAGLDRIVAQPVPGVGLGRAVMDRLAGARRGGGLGGAARRPR